MVFKMLGIEHSWQQCKGALPKPRQVFVTASRVLADKVQEVFTKLQASHLPSDGAPEAFANTTPPRNATEKGEDLLDDDDDDDDDGGEYQDNLPRRFSELSDAHFPLFVTFDRVSFSIRIRKHVADLPKSYAGCWRPSCRSQCPIRRTLSFSVMKECLTIL